MKKRIASALIIYLKTMDKIIEVSHYFSRLHKPDKIIISFGLKYFTIKFPDVSFIDLLFCKIEMKNG